MTPLSPSRDPCLACPSGAWVSLGRCFFSISRARLLAAPVLSLRGLDHAVTVCSFHRLSRPLTRLHFLSPLLHCPPAPAAALQRPPSRLLAAYKVCLHEEGGPEPFCDWPSQLPQLLRCYCGSCHLRCTWWRWVLRKGHTFLFSPWRPFIVEPFQKCKYSGD